MNHRLAVIRRTLLSVALSLVLALFIVDRYAAYIHRPSADATRVAIYTTAWCPYCARLRADLAASGVRYTEYDVERSLQGALGFWALRGRGVPVSAVGPTGGVRLPRRTDPSRVAGARVFVSNGGIECTLIDNGKRDVHVHFELVDRHRLFLP